MGSNIRDIATFFFGILTSVMENDYLRKRNRMEERGVWDEEY